MAYRGFVALVLCAAAALSWGCAEADAPDLPPAWRDGPGTEAWNSDEVGCKSDADCNSNEACGGGVCQMRVCEEPSYESVAPLAAFRYLSLDGEVSVLRSGHYVDQYDPAGAIYVDSYDFSNDFGTIIDIAGGDFFGERPQHLAYAHEDTDVITFDDGGQIAAGIWPRAIAAGDVDGDGLDELVVLGTGGHLAICRPKDGTCIQRDSNDLDPVDVAVADVDGDRYREPVLLYRDGDKARVVIVNVNAPVTQEEESISFTVGDGDPASCADYSETCGFFGIAAGDLDGDNVADLVLLEDGGSSIVEGSYYYGADFAHVVSALDGTERTRITLGAHVADMTIGDTDSDGVSDALVLNSENPDDGTDSSIEVRRSIQLDIWEKEALQYQKGVTRLAMYDADGDSPAARLAQGPVMVAGAVVPTAVLVFPPYYATWTQGRGSNVSLGNGTQESESVAQTVSLHSGVTVAVGVSAKIFFYNYNSYVMRESAVTDMTTSGVSIGKTWNIDADPTLGRTYAGVVLASGCFHGYRYVSDDPANKMGGSDQELGLLMPVGGQTQLWSTRRYNAMARALGTMPAVEVPYDLGDAASYPSEARQLDGAAIDPADVLFKKPPELVVSDVGSVGFSMSLSTSDANTTATTITVGSSHVFGFGSGSGGSNAPGGGSAPITGASAVGGLLGFVNANVSYDSNTSWSQGYTITVGEDASFSGTVPLMPDVPSTPEDEFAEHRYSFSPLVYRHHYTDTEGGDASFYVITYAVGK